MRIYCLMSTEFQPGKVKRVLKMADGEGSPTIWFSSQMAVFGLYEIRNKNI